MVKIAHAEGVVWSTVTKVKENKKSLKKLLIPQHSERECCL